MDFRRNQPEKQLMYLCVTNYKTVASNFFLLDGIYYNKFQIDYIILYMDG